MARVAASKLKCITLDVTGTLLAYRGHLGDYYCSAARRAGQQCPTYAEMHVGFKRAYEERALEHPCFGRIHNIPSEDWWRRCVRDAFAYSGKRYDEEVQERVFQDIFQAFASTAAYKVYPDARPFLHWAKEQKGLVIGIVSNASDQYPEKILPGIGLYKGIEWDFGVFSGIDGLEKPDVRVFELAMQRAGGLEPSSVLHIGDSVEKDVHPAVGLGMHALLLDRFNRADVVQLEHEGIVVVPDLLEARDWILTNGLA